MRPIAAAPRYVNDGINADNDDDDVADNHDYELNMAKMMHNMQRRMIKNRPKKEEADGANAKNDEEPEPK